MDDKKMEARQKKAEAKQRKAEALQKKMEALELKALKALETKQVKALKAEVKAEAMQKKAIEKQAAQKLQQHLLTIPGSSVEIVEEGIAIKGNTIYLGQTNFAKSKKIDFNKNGVLQTWNDSLARAQLNFYLSEQEKLRRQMASATLQEVIVKSKVKSPTQL